MTWFDRWLARKVRRGLESQRAIEESEAVVNISSAKIAHHRLNTLAERDGVDSVADLNFRIYRASNGYVMEVRQVDKRTERQNLNMHIITDQEDLGDSIAKIITLESLKVQ